MISVPVTTRETVAENRCGFHIEDPYRWLEETTPEVAQWRCDQLRYTNHRLGELANRSYLKQRFIQLFQGNGGTTPIARNNRLFWLARKPHSADVVLYMQTPIHGASEKPRIVLQNAGNLTAIYVARDGSTLVFTCSACENSSQSLQVLDVDRGERLADIIPATLYPLAQSWPGVNKVVWAQDHQSFYYSRRSFDAPEEEPSLHQKLYFHRLGENVCNDILVFDTPNKHQIPYPELSDDGRYLIVTVRDMSTGQALTDLYLHKIQADGGCARQYTVFERITGFFHAKIQKGVLYLLTNYQSANRCVLAALLPTCITAAQAGGPWWECFNPVVAETEQAIRNWCVSDDYLLLETIKDAASALMVYTHSGDCLGEIALPDRGCIDDITTDAGCNQFYFRFSSMRLPPADYHLDLNDNNHRIQRQQASPLQRNDFALIQTHYCSFDGVRVPITLVHRQGLKKNGAHPVVICGYGGFGLSILPAWRAEMLPLLEQGGVYAIAHIRGGGELGEHWRNAAVRENRQTAFNDFIYAGQWLIQQGYTNPQRLACYGWSNGGLLMNVVAQQRPDLWRAVIAGAPVSDMLRFHNAHHGKQWSVDYGCPDEPDDIAFLMAYSPCHNMPKKIAAPAMMVLAADEDDRVAPWHGYKILAHWQAANSGDAPVLLWREQAAGHHGSAEVSRAVARYVDIWSFLFWQLDIQP